ncbi:MAG: metallophosphoesterase [Opitutaceae bacterium]
MSIRAFFRPGWFLLVIATLHAAAPDDAEALLVIVGDQHSAYERTAQVVAQIDRLRAENPRLPFAILVDGDVFEFGNVVARRSAGAVDFAMLAAFAQRAPTVLNLGNHEPEFYDLPDTIKRLRATGVMVISNITDRATGAPYIPASTTLKLGRHEAVVVGVSTDLLASFRVAVRPSVDLAEPVAWARKNFPELLRRAPVKIVLSHAGLLADRGMLPLVPDGTLFAGAHDHIRFAHRAGRTVYVHSGSWNEFLTLASLRVDAAGPNWEVRHQRIELTDRTDPALAALIRDTQTEHLTPEDIATVGRSPREFSPDEAARFAVGAVRTEAGVDAAFVGRTTFGAGLPLGEVSRVALDACVRFDSVICTAEVTGVQLRAILAMSNENEATPFAQRHGDYLVADGAPAIDPARRYRIATTDWIARNPGQYLGDASIVLKEQPALRLKTIMTRALNPGAAPKAAP